MNAALYAMQGEWDQAAWSSVAMIPIAGSAIKSGAKAGKKALSAVGNLAPVVKTKKRITSLKLTYRVTEEGAGFFERIRKALDGICNSMNHSQYRLAVADGVDMAFEDAEFVVKAVDDAGNTIGIVKVGGKGVDSVNDIFTAGKKAFDNFDIDNAYVKPKHLSITGGNGQKFIGASKAEAERFLKDALLNGKIVSITDNGLTKAGNASYEIIIDAGKTIGTKGETWVKIVISSDGGMLSAYPIK